MRTCMYLIVALALVGCEKKKTASPGPGTGTGTGSASAVAPADRNAVEVFVDEQSVLKISPADVASWPRLDALVPEEARRLGTWEKLVFAPTTQLEKPAQSHPDKVPVVFPGKDGKPAFGMFDAVALANKGEPAFRADNVQQIRITISKTERGGMHQGSTGEAVDPTKIVVKIKTPSGEKQITGPEILKLPREAQPGQEDTQGWRVTQFLEAAGVTKYEAITLVDAGGTTVPLTKKELDPKTATPFVKLNKQGQLRFRMFTKKGEGWESGADLRSLVAISVR